jgi:SAM-dependent methyltransferase
MSAIEFLSPAADVSMADEWFEFANADHFWMQWRHRVLIRELQRLKYPFRRALDIGCGNGVVRQMIEHDLDITVDGCDLNEYALQLAKPGKGRLFVYNILDQDPTMVGRYDLILLMDVIEHLEDDLGFLQAALAHLNPGGFVAINVPAHMAFYGKYDVVAGHMRRYSARSLRSLLRRANVTPFAVCYWGLPLIPLLLMRNLMLRFVPQEDTIRAGFAQSNPAAGTIFRLLQRGETSLPFRVPVGTSLLALAQFGSRQHD